MFSDYDFFFSVQKNLLYNTRLSKQFRSHIISHNDYKGITTLRNRCIINNRSRAVCSKFNISRIPLKTFGFGGFINGLSRSSW